MRKVLLVILIAGFVVIRSQNKPLVLPMDYSSHILIKGKINGEYAANLLFDTGADGLLLDEEYFNGTGITINRSQRAQLPGAGTTPQMITVLLDRTEVKFDTITFVPRYVPLMNLRGIVGEKADGIIGPDFLRNYLTEIDYEKNEIRLYLDQDIKKGYDSLVLEVISNRYYLPVTIKASNKVLIKGKCQLDVGSGGTIYMTSPTAGKYKLKENISKKMKYFNVSGGAGGRVEGYHFRAPEITIGKTVLKEVPMDWSTDTVGALSKSSHNGLLGNEILERFKLIVDFKRGVLYLKPKSNLKDPFISTVTGFSYVNKINSEDGLIVTGLFENGNAEKAGIKAGDKIVAIENIQVNKILPKDLKELLNEPGKDIKLSIIREGKELILNLMRKQMI